MRIILGFLCCTFAWAQVSPTANEFLIQGELRLGEETLQKQSEMMPNDSEVGFGLGFLQFVKAVETLAQSWHRYGLEVDQGQGFGLPLLRLPVPPNPTPETIAYEDFRAVLERFLADLTKAEATLSQVNDPELKLSIDFGLIRLDLDADGEASRDEVFWQIYAQFDPRFGAADFSEEQKRFPIVFDQGDVYWLRGYIHLLSAMLEVYLAHDSRELFERTAHLLYPKVASPHHFLNESSGESIQGFEPDLIVDAISMIHLINLKLEDKEGMQRALAHLEAVVAQSRLSWPAILAETDNDREWLPNAQQDSVLPAAVTPEMIEGWQIFLDEAEAILQGEILLPHWRVRDGRGINLRRVFTEPQGLDLILWIQGSAATPYLEQGSLTERETWLQLQQMFGGNFLGFAFWFN